MEKSKKIILGIILLCLLIGAGIWLVQKPGKRLASETTQSQTNTQSPATTTTTTTTTAVPAEQAPAYLDIKEWGIRLPLSDTVKDAYYVVPLGVYREADGVPGQVKIGLASLDSIGCSAREFAAKSTSDSGNQEVGSILRVDPNKTHPVTGKTYAETYPGGIEVGKHYYVFGYNKQKPCTTEKDMTRIYTDFESAVLSLKNQ
jgi:hypothetical protein